MKLQKLNRLVSAALFSALVCVATLVVQIPIPIGSAGGYFNIGDCFVLTAGIMLGAGYGAVAAGLGAMIADLYAYPLYAPATFVIKALMAVTAYFLYKTLKSVFGNKLSVLAKIISAIAAEALMVLGYFIYEAFILGYGLAASASILGNITQGVVGAVSAVILITALEKAASKSKVISSFFKAG